MSPPDLYREAREFKNLISGVLNRSIATGVTIGVVKATDDDGRPIVMLGADLTNTNYKAGSFPLHIRKSPRLYMKVFYVLDLSEDGPLSVVSSVITVATDLALKSLLFHYDFDRGKTKYPEAHIQIAAESDAWTSVMPGKKPMAKMHFPAGHPAFRPILEDVVEFLVVEELVEESVFGWQHEIARTRAEFRALQLRKVLRDPGMAEVAHGVLDELEQAVQPTAKRGKHRR